MMATENTDHDKAFQALINDFIDEDTDTWIEAAKKIGHLAYDGNRNAREFLASLLKSRENIHYHRHSWCALAAYLSLGAEREGAGFEPHFKEVHDGTAVVSVPHLLGWSGEWLARMILSIAPQSDLSIADIAGVKSSYFITWLEKQAARFENDIRKMQEKGNEVAVRSKQKGLAILKDRTSLLRDVKSLPRDSLIKSEVEWIFSSFLAGSSRQFLESLGFDSNVLVRSLSPCASQGKIGYISSLPRLLSELDPEYANVKWLELMASHMWAGQAPWGNKADLLGQLILLARQWNLGNRRAMMNILHPAVPDSVRQLFADYHAARMDPDVSFASRERLQIETIRKCEEYFVDFLRWQEASSGQKTTIAVFVHLMMDLPAESPRRQILDLDHRISLTIDLIERTRESNRELQVPLVRLLKQLFNIELVNLRNRFVKQPTEKRRSKLFNVCQRQIHIIEPILDGWNLRETIYKDMATIASRTLDVCYSYSQDQLDVEGFPDYFKLLYCILYALPEAPFLIDLKEFAKCQEIKDDLDIIYKLDRDVPQPAENSPIFKYDQPLFAPGDEFSRFPAAGPNTASLINLLIGSPSQKKVNDVHPEKCYQQLFNILAVQQNLIIAGETGYVLNKGPSFIKEIADDLKIRTRALVQEFTSTISEIDSLFGSMRYGRMAPRDLKSTLWSLMDHTQHLLVLTRKHLPLVERVIVCSYLSFRLEHIKRKLTQLSAVMDQENEKKAQEILETGHAEDKNLISRWMYDRYMLRELAGKNRILRFFLSPLSIMVFITVLVGLTILANRLTGGSHIADSPWVAAPYLGGLAVILIFLLAARNVFKKMTFPGGIRPTAFFLPPIVATLFLGIMESLSSDDIWAGAFMKSPVPRLLSILIWLMASFYFVKKVMLGGQSPSAVTSPQKVINKRAWSILSIGLWQSFFLLLIFSILQGPSMVGPGHMDLIDKAQFLPPLAKTAGAYLPNVIDTRILSFQVLIFPWALLSWTVRLFFFSAIFEQIMKRQ